MKIQQRNKLKPSVRVTKKKRFVFKFTVLLDKMSLFRNELKKTNQNMK